MLPAFGKVAVKAAHLTSTGTLVMLLHMGTGLRMHSKRDEPMKTVLRIKGVCLLTLCVLASWCFAGAGAAEKAADNEVTIDVDCGQVVNTMRGGMGASWHADGDANPLWRQAPAISRATARAAAVGAAIRRPRTIGHGSRSTGMQVGSAWTGTAWRSSSGSTSRERGKFAFDSPEMRILYRILDWNQKNGADVFFQQMWCNAAWLAYPEFRDDPVGRVHSAPADLDAFADGLATLMEHLVTKRGYTCIKWLCITNEPGARVLLVAGPAQQAAFHRCRTWQRSARRWTGGG